MKVNYAIPILACMMFGMITADADHYVSPAGKHIDPYDSWENAATNIQTAVDEALAGSTVWIGSGEYTPSGAGRIVTITKSISLRGAAVRESIIINGAGTRQGIDINLSAPAHVMVEGLTLTNCIGVAPESVSVPPAPARGSCTIV